MTDLPTPDMAAPHEHTFKHSEIPDANCDVCGISFRDAASDHMSVEGIVLALWHYGYNCRVAETNPGDPEYDQYANEMQPEQAIEQIQALRKRDLEKMAQAWCLDQNEVDEYIANEGLSQ